MKLSQLFGLNKTQYELDFIDIDPDHDLPLFIDPYFLSKRTDSWSTEATRSIRIFFQHLITLLHDNSIDSARELFSYLGEPNETCLGLSRGAPQGRGVGTIDTNKIFDSFIESEAVRTGIVEDIEDCRIFVDGVDKDKTSDMTTNIIRSHLIRYTQTQCRLWNIQLQPNAPSGFCWNKNTREWENSYTDILFVENKRILLVPKAIVTYAKKYTAQQYHQHFVLNFLQHEHLRMRSALVRRKIHKDGTETLYVTKQSLKDEVAPLSKPFLARFTQQHPEIFADFKARAIENTVTISNEELSNEDVNRIVDHLIMRLRQTPPGNEHASNYHRLVVGILELIFYPNLIAPQIEREIHEGRKRVDIVFDNAATSGFFFHLHNTRHIPCQYIFVECKNYTRDVRNPELDQLAGRFSPNRGRFGLLLCRSIADMPGIISSCADTYRDDRGVMIPITDDDLIALLNSMRERHFQEVDTLLSNRIREIILH